MTMPAKANNRTFFTVCTVLLCSAAVIASGLMLRHFYSTRQAQEEQHKSSVCNEPTSRSISLVFAGDLMQHLPQIEAAQKDGASYDYSETFKYIAPFFRSQDLVFINLETTLSDNGPYSGYPAFRAPAQLAYDMKTAGIDVALLANNHILDRGARGVKRTIKALDSAGIIHTGAHICSGQNDASNAQSNAAGGDTNNTQSTTGNGQSNAGGGDTQGTNSEYNTQNNMSLQSDTNTRSVSSDGNTQYNTRQSSGDNLQYDTNQISTNSPHNPHQGKISSEGNQLGSSRGSNNPQGGICNDNISKVSYSSENVLTIERNGFTISVLNYTYGTNGIPTPRGVAVNRIDTAAIAHNIAQIPVAENGYIIAFIHWGIEYKTVPTEKQKQLAEWLHKKGVDFVVGGHPHVIQPLEVMTEAGEAASTTASDTYSPQESNSVERVVGMTSYSLGNFVSNQSRENTDGGLIIRLTIKEYNNGSREIKPEYFFGWTYKKWRDGRWSYNVIPSYMADSLLYGDSLATIRYTGFTDNARRIIGDHNGFSEITELD